MVIFLLYDVDRRLYSKSIIRNFILEIIIIHRERKQKEIRKKNIDLILQSRLT